MKLNKLIYLLLVITIVLSINLAFRPFHSSLQWAQKPFHSSLEAIGALCAFVLSTVLFMLRKYSAHKPYHLWIICGLLSMGLLDFFHAFGDPGESFVWLHSSATLMGGFLFAMVWLPDRMLSPRVEYYLPVAIIILSFLLGLSLMSFPDLFPLMLKQGEFTLTAKSINLVGGLFFISASIWFTNLYLLKKDPEGILFANHCLLFGLAGIIFDFSQLWDTQWWLWHFIRLTAYVIALYYVFNVYKQTANALQESEAQLRATFNQAAVGIWHTLG